MPNRQATMSTGEPAATESRHGWFWRRPSIKDHPAGTSSAAYPAARRVRRAARRKRTGDNTGTALLADSTSVDRYVSIPRYSRPGGVSLVRQVLDYS